MAYHVDTKDGRVVSGIVAAENSDSVTLKLAGGVTDRGSMSRVKIMRIFNGEKKEIKVKPTDIVQPGDTIQVGDRLF